MKKPLLLLSIILSSSIISQLAFAEPSNIYYKQQELLQYVDSGHYNKELSDKAALAKDILAKAISHNKQAKKKEKLAVVLDIDETVLSSYATIKEAKFGGSKAFFDSHIKQADARAIAPMKNFYQFAKDNKVAIFFVTGRGYNMKPATIKNLKNEGFKGYKHIYFKPKKYDNDHSVIPYKAAMRTDIEHQGYQIILSVGDQDSDIKGGHAKNGIKLPNPFYYLA